MHSIVLACSLLLVAAAPGPAEAGGQCWTEKDPDQRAYCRALESNSQGDCSFIGDSSLKATCRARTTGQPSHCNEAGSGFRRDECRRLAEQKGGAGH